MVTTYVCVVGAALIGVVVITTAVCRIRTSVGVVAGEVVAGCCVVLFLVVCVAVLLMLLMEFPILCLA